MNPRKFFTTTPRHAPIVTVSPRALVLGSVIVCGLTLALNAVINPDLGALAHTQELTFEPVSDALISIFNLLTTKEAKA